MDQFPADFEKCEDLRSVFIHEIILKQLELTTGIASDFEEESEEIPRKFLRYWHDPSDLPDDVRKCLDSWNCLIDEGFEFFLFDDISAANYIAEVFGEREQRAFKRCTHPAMRCDFLRMCFVLAEGGFYVDADDVLVGDGWRNIFRDGRLKVQPLCYDIAAGSMLPSAEIWQPDLPIREHVFYVNNNPIAAPANHPVLQRALASATEKLLDEDPSPEIQSTTGPGNFTAALAAHARNQQMLARPFDFEFLRGWESIAEVRWDLSYRGDSRNWRNVYGC